MKENWYALFLSIVKDVSPDKAIKAIFNKCIRSCDKKFTKRSTKRKYRAEIKYIDDPLKLIELKENHTYKEIAKLYNTYTNKIYMDIKRYKQSISEVI